MNYMPDITLFSLISKKKDTFEDLKKHLSIKLSYLDCRIEFTERENSLWIDLSGNGAEIRFFTVGGKKKRKLIENNSFIVSENIQFIELSSGPNDNYSYYPVFCAIELELSMYPGAYIWGIGNKFISLERLEELYEDCAFKLANLVLEEKVDDITSDTSHQLFLRIKEVFPGLFEPGKKCSELEKTLQNFIEEKPQREIETKTAEELHEMLKKYWFSYDMDYLKAIVKHPNCDLATAKMIYWMGSPYLFENMKACDIEEYDKEEYDLIQYILNRAKEDGYRKSSLSYSPTNDNGEDKTQYFENKQSIPEEML